MVDLAKDQETLCGLIVIDKPAGPTSMDVVANVRRRAGGARTGHAGTLDPLATGVLVLAIGRATKALGEFMATDKRYETTIDLSAFTSTDDAAGERMDVVNVQAVARQATEAALSRFTGRIMQRPPAFSAIKVGGRRAYKLARKGQAVEIEPRAVTVHSIDLVRYDWPLVELKIHCAHGFYVRSLARELGQALDTGGFCASIRRTAVGPFTVAQARRLDELPASLSQADLTSLDEARRMVAAGS